MKIWLHEEARESLAKEEKRKTIMAKIQFPPKSSVYMSWLTIGKSYIPPTSLIPVEGSGDRDVAEEEVQRKEKKSKKRRRNEEEKKEKEERSSHRAPYLVAGRPSQGMVKLTNIEEGYTMDRRGERGLLMSESWSHPPSFSSSSSSSSSLCNKSTKEKQYLRGDTRCSKKFRYFGQSGLYSLSQDFKRLRYPALLRLKSSSSSSRISIGEYVPLPPSIENDNYSGFESSSEEDLTIFESDGALNERVLFDRRKFYNSHTRIHPHSPAAWIDFIVAQNSLAALSFDANGILTMLDRFSFCAWRNRPLIEKQISIIQEAWRSSEHMRHNSALSLLYMRLVTVSYAEEDVNLQWKSVLAANPASVELWKEYLLSIRGRIKEEDVKKAGDEVEAAVQSMFPVLKSKDSASLIFRIDICTDFLRVEMERGKTELVVAAVQALLETSLRGTSLHDLERSWDLGTGDGVLRLGDTIDEKGRAVEETWLTADEMRRRYLRKLIEEDEKAASLAEVDAHVAQMLQSFRPSASALISSSENTTTLKMHGEDTSSIQEKEDGAEEEAWVYSRVHGYRIPVNKTDSSLPYKKILSELNDFSAPSIDLTQLSAEEILKLYEKPAALVETEPSSPSNRDVYLVRGVVEEALSSLHWAPLHALCKATLPLSSAHPERVILFDDFRPLLTSMMNYPSPLPFSTSFRLLLHCFGALGIAFPRLFSSLTLRARLHFSAEDYLDPLTSMLFLDDKETLQSTIRTILEVPDLPSSTSRMATFKEAVSIFPLSRRVAQADGKLLADHFAIKSLKLDSRLAFCLRLLQQILSLKYFPRQYEIQLRRILMALFLQIYLTKGHNNKENKEEEGKAREEFRALCRSLVTDALPDVSINCDGILAEESSSMVMAANNLALHFDMSLWVAYCETEIAIGEVKTAHKIAVKTIEALLSDVQTELMKPSQQSLLALDVICAAPNALKLFHLAIQLEMRTDESNPSFEDAIRKSLRLALSLVKGHPMGGKAKRKGSNGAFNAIELLELQRCLQSKFQQLLHGACTEVQTSHTNAPLAQLQVDFAVSIDAAEGGGGSSLADCATLFAWTQMLFVFHSRLLDLNGYDGRTDLLTAITSADAVFLSTIDILTAATLNTSLDPTTPSRPPPLAHYLGTMRDGSPSLVVQRSIAILERLHERRLELLLFAVQNATRLSTQLNFPTLSSQRPLRSLLMRALSSALQDFPLNSSFLHLMRTLESGSIKGYLRIRSYIRTLQSRGFWGGGLMPQERLFEISVEVRYVLLLLSHFQLAPTSSLVPILSGKEYSLHHLREIPDFWRVECWPDALVLRLTRAIERMLEDPRCCSISTLWRLYIALEIKRGRFNAAKKVYLRAVQSCPQNAELWRLVLGDLRRCFSDQEVDGLLNKMEESGILLRCSSA